MTQTEAHCYRYTLKQLFKQFYKLYRRDDLTEIEDYHVFYSAADTAILLILRKGHYLNIDGDEVAKTVRMFEYDQLMHILDYFDTKVFFMAMAVGFSLYESLEQQLKDTEESIELPVNLLD